MALTASLNKSTYSPGETMTLTVTTAPGERNVDVPIAVHVEVAGLGGVDLTGLVDKPPLAITVVDSSRVWTPVSDDETTAIFTATA
jgi:hypothetical protein